MIRSTLLALALVAAPALAQQPAQQPVARTTAAQRADTTKAKARRTHRAARSRTTKAKPAAPRDTTTHN